MKGLKGQIFSTLSLILLVALLCTMPAFLKSPQDLSEPGNLQAAVYAQDNCQEYCAIYQEFLTAKQKYESCLQSLNAKCDEQTTRKAYQDYMAAYSKFTQYQSAHGTSTGCNCQPSQNQQDSKYPCNEYWLYWNQAQGKHKLYSQCANNPSCSSETKKQYYNSYQEALDIYNLFVSKYGTCPDWCTGSTGSIQPPVTASLTASFTMSTETPAANEAVTFKTSSTCTGGKIVEFQWYLDGVYLKEIGNLGQWQKAIAGTGPHTMKLVATDDTGRKEQAEKQFRVVEAQQLTLTAGADPPVCLTGGKTTVKGRLTYGGKGLDRASVDIIIHRTDKTIDKKSAVTESDGSWRVDYTVTKIPITVPPKPEIWTIQVTATPAEPQYNKTSATTTIEVLPVYFKLHSIKLVQVTEPAVIGGTTYIAAGKEAGIRVMVSCPSLEGKPGVSKPEVMIKFEADGGTIGGIKDQKLISIGPVPEPVDFIFKLDPGVYHIGVYLDPDYKYGDPTYLGLDRSITAKKMKDLKLKFIPVDLNLKTASDTRGYLEFCKSQESFIRNVYPLSNSNLSFHEYIVGDPRPPWAASRYLPVMKKFMLLKWLSLYSYFEDEGAKNVGIVENSTAWFNPEEDGYSAWIFFGGYFDLVYYTRSVCVKYRPDPKEGVTAHEIGHTLGLNRYWEEYTPLTLGNKVNGLILRDGKIYDLSIQAEKDKAFYNGVRYIICFMGDNQAADIAHTGTWVCAETYPDLFKYLMDPPPEKVLYVGGTIYNDNKVDLDNFYILNGEPDLHSVAPSDEAYTLLCLSSTGETLYSTNFGKKPKEFMGFGFTIPFPDKTAAVVFKQGQQVLKEVKRSPNAPTVQVISPNGSEVTGKNLEIRWQSQDADGGNLAHSVLYSNDGGATWKTLALEISDTNYTIDAGNLPGGNQCLVKIIATDGFNTGYGQSDGFFSVSNKAPLAFIESPKDGEVYRTGQVVPLQSLAYDADSEGISGLTFEWSSSINGSLKGGEETAVTNLSPGTHEIALTVRDSSGSTAKDKVTIKVEGAGRDNNTGGGTILSATTVIRDWDKSNDWFGFTRGNVCAGCGFNQTGGDFFIADRGSDSIIHVFESPGIIDMGNVAIDSVKEAPGSGYQEGAVPVAGHTYIVRSKGKYSRFRIEQIKSPPNVPITEYSIKWAYQPDGTRSFGDSIPGGDIGGGPIARFTSLPIIPASGDPVVVTSISSDPEGRALKHAWYVDGKYRADIGNVSSWEWTGAEDGEHTVKLIVEDASGRKNEYSKKITVGKSSGLCFIATAAYGSETAAELDTLRAFRDKVLMRNEFGESLVSFYYKASPPLAEFIAQHESVRTLVREDIIDPIVHMLEASRSYWNN